MDWWGYCYIEILMFFNNKCNDYIEKNFGGYEVSVFYKKLIYKIFTTHKRGCAKTKIFVWKKKFLMKKLICSYKKWFQQDYFFSM